MTGEIPLVRSEIFAYANVEVGEIDCYILDVCCPIVFVGNGLDRSAGLDDILLSYVVCDK